MRIIQAIAGAQHGGAELFFPELIRELQARAPYPVEQKIIMRAYEDRVGELRQAGFDVTEMPFGGALDLMGRLRMRREIDSFGPDIVQSWMNRATAFVPKPRGKFIHIGWLADVDEERHNIKYYESCDHLIALTEDMKQKAVNAGWDPSRVHLIPLFSLLRPSAPVTRAELNTPFNAKVILTTARLHPRKAHDVLFKAFAKVPDAYLWLSGEGELREELTKMAGELGIMDRVRFLGWRTDHLSLLQEADLFVLPSRFEPFGIVILEAWSQGCPVIAAAASGPRSIITSGKDGLLVPIDNPDVLRETMITALNNKGLCANLVANAHKTYESLYARESVVKNYLDLYASLTERHKMGKAA